MTLTPSAPGPARLVGRTLILVCLGLMAGATDSWLRPVKLAASDPASQTAPQLAPSPGPTSPTNPPTTPTPSAAGAPDVKPAAADEPLKLRINLAQARKLFEGGTPFLDARTDEEFAAGHIAGAFHLPGDAFDRPGGADALKFLDQRAPVVIYCGGGDCHASEYVAIRLEEAGFKDYHIMEDGFPAWQAKGYDIATGEK